jgi:hypothetical protein
VDLVDLLGLEDLVDPVPRYRLVCPVDLVDQLRLANLVRLE